jgi:tetratricopeptide (TPR) repeat protein
VDLNPRDPTSYYLLGEFTYGFAHLSWYQRKLVSTIFAAPPNGTYEEALEHFLKAESLGDDIYHKNKLMIGKCYYNLKNFVEAKKYLAKCASITPLNEADRKAKEESKILLGKISKEKLSRPN